MTIDSNTFGWMVCTGIAVWMAFKYWKKLIKFFVAVCAMVFVLFVVKMKEMYDAVVTPKPKQEVSVTIPVDSFNVVIPKDSSGIVLKKIDITITEK